MHTILMSSSKEILTALPFQEVWAILFKDNAILSYGLLKSNLCYVVSLFELLSKIIAIMIMVPMGIQSAACAIIGEQIGANRVPLAKAYFHVMSIITLLTLAIIQTIVYFARKPIVRVFTEDPAVAELADSCVFIIILAFIPDIIQGSM